MTLLQLDTLGRGGFNHDIVIIAKCMTHINDSSLSVLFAVYFLIQQPLYVYVCNFKVVLM